MKKKNLLAVWLVLFFTLSGTLFANEYATTSFYVAYDSTDGTQYALVIPAVNKVYTHKAGHILPTDLKQVDTQFASFPTYDNGELCFSDLVSSASGDNGASVMAGKCYDVNFFYTQKQTLQSGVTFILTYTPTDKVYEGLAGNASSFKLVREGETIHNENSISNSDYTNYQFDLATATVSGVTEGIPADGTASLSGNAGDVVNPITAVLELDVDGDGLYAGKGDRTLSVEARNGSFTFDNISLVKGVKLNGQLIVTAEGYAPLQKLVSFEDGDSVVVDASAALNKPALKEVVNLSGLSSSARMNSVMEFGIRKEGTKLESFSRLISLSQFRAEANLPVDDGRVSTYTFDTGSIPADVKTVEVTMQAFDSTKPDDIQNFPGSFRGYGEGGLAKASGSEVGLESAAFDLLVMKDQNGKEITLETPANKLNKNVDVSSCVNKWTRWVDRDQDTIIMGWGDYDSNDTGYQVPIWSNDNSENAWKFVGIANYDHATTTFEMCIPDTWGSGYLNCDSPIAFQQPTLMCVNTFDQRNVLISDVNINAHTVDSNGDSLGQYAYATTNSNGHASFEVTDDDMSHWVFGYSGAYTGWNNVDVTAVPVAVTSPECTYELNITNIQNPYTANVEVTALDTHGQPVGAGAWVALQHRSYDEHNYYKTGYTDENSKVTFMVESDITYVARYGSGESNVTVDANVVAPETADSGTYADVNVSDINAAPRGYMYLSSSRVNILLTESIRVSVSAYDRNRNDTLSLASLTVDGTAVTPTNAYESVGGSYYYFNGDINVSAMARGQHTVVATISDGTLTTSFTQMFTIEGNRAPVIASPLIAENNTSLTPTIQFNIDESGSIIKPNTYLFTANTYDPDGDTVTTTLELNGTVITTEQTLADGNYEINVTAFDGTETVSRLFNFDVKNEKPVIGQAGISPNPVNLSVNENMMVYAFVTDPDGDGVGSVVAKDMNTSIEYTMHTIDGLYFTVDINGSEIGVVDMRKFEIMAYDAASIPKASDIREVTVSIRDVNEAPRFYLPLSDQTVHLGTPVTVSATGEDPEGSRVSFLWQVDGVPFLGAVAGTMAGEEVITLTGLSEGDHVVTCTLTDNDPDDPKSTTGSATITVENTAPVFSVQPASTTVEIGNDAVLECVASDIDTPIQYAWRVDGAVVSGETGTTLTLNSATEVTHTVSCTATDSFGKAAQSSTATVVIYDPTKTHPLTVHVPVEGVIVTVHDANNKLKLIESKVTDATGTASFNVPGTSVSFSIAFDPSVVMPESEIWTKVRDGVLWDASNNCMWDQELNITECATADWCTLSTADSIPVWVVNAAKLTDSNDNNVTGESIDTDHNGIITSAETYTAVLAHEDANQDGQISWAEMGDAEYATNAYIGVPIREYTFNWDNQDQQEYGQGFCANDNLVFDINVTNISGYINNLNVGGSGYGSVYESNTSKMSLGTKVYIYRADTDGNYDFSVQMSGDAGQYTELLLDQTTGTLVDGKTYDAATLTPSTYIDANVTRDVEGIYFRVSGDYKGIDLANPQYVTGEGNTTQYRILNDDRLYYAISAYQYVSRGNANVNHTQYNYWGDGLAKTSYIASDYPMLDVDVDLNGTTEVISFSGSEVDKVDFSRIGLSGEAYGNGCDYDCGVFDIQLFNFASPTATVALNDLNISEIYPTAFANGILSAMQSATNTHTEIYALEFKNKSGAEVIDTLISTNGNYYNLWESEPNRLAGYDLYESLTAVAKLSDKKVEKEAKPANPFSIKLDARKFFK